MSCMHVVHVYFLCMYVPKVCVCEHMAALLVIIEYAYVIRNTHTPYIFIYSIESDARMCIYSFSSSLATCAGNGPLPASFVTVASFKLPVSSSLVTCAGNDPLPASFATVASFNSTACLR